jgi:hypothetical protein
MTLISRINAALPWRASRFTVPLIIAALVVLALLSPAANTSDLADQRLSSFLSGPNGARGIFDVARRLGWRVERKTRAPIDSLRAGNIVALLAPVDQLSERETTVLLAKIRNGTSLLAVGISGPLQDSLHLRAAERFVRMPLISATAMRCPSRDSRSVYQLMGDSAAVSPFPPGTKLPDGATVFLRATYPNQMYERFAAFGFPLGKGRVIAISDPNILRNDYIRICKWGLGVSVVQMLEYLTARHLRSETRIIFDEFHQGFGPQPSVTRAIGRFLFETAPGAMLLQLLIAAGILLLAISPRPIRPTPLARIQRRSQFEHVSALSSAYKQISATRTVAQRLVRGLRRRLATAQRVAGNQSDDEAAFLRQVAAAHPDVSSETALVTTALTRPVSPAELIAVGEAIKTIERTIKR